MTYWLRHFIVCPVVAWYDLLIAAFYCMPCCSLVWLRDQQGERYECPRTGCLLHCYGNHNGQAREARWAHLPAHSRHSRGHHETGHCCHLVRHVTNCQILFSHVICSCLRYNKLIIIPSFQSIDGQMRISQVQSRESCPSHSGLELNIFWPFLWYDVTNYCTINLWTKALTF